jgi:hypothetical protein
MGRHKTMTARLNFWVDAEVENKLLEYSEDHGLSISEAARQILNERFGKQDKLTELENRLERVESILSSNGEDYHGVKRGARNGVDSSALLAPRFNFLRCEFNVCDFNIDRTLFPLSRN